MNIYIGILLHKGYNPKKRRAYYYIPRNIMRKVASAQGLYPDELFKNAVTATYKALASARPLLIFSSFIYFI